MTTKILRNENGVALLLVLSTVVILTTVMVNFSFNTQIDKLKAYNVEDKNKARLTAEAGLNFALIRLRLYQEAFNLLQQNENMKQLVNQQLLNQIWNFPFVFPIPEMSTMTVIQKQALQKFSEENFLEGNLNLTIESHSQKLNLNSMSVNQVLAQRINADREANPDKYEGDALNFNIESQLMSLLEVGILRKSEQDEYFAARYQGTDFAMLVNNIKYYMSEEGLLEGATINPGDFAQIPLEVKQRKMHAFHELYMLPGWTDDLVDLIKQEFTAYPSVMIDLNKITGNILRLLFPLITDEEVAEFFAFKNDPEQQSYFNTLEDFKRYCTDIGAFVSESDFDELINKFKAQNIQFGVAPTLFQVTSEAVVGRSTYKIVAMVALPVQPKPDATPPANPTTGESAESGDDSEETNPNGDGDTPPNGGTSGDSNQQPDLLLLPRVIEIRVD